MSFIELARFMRNLEESRELTPVKMFLACDELIPLKRFYAFRNGTRVPLGWEAGLIDQRLGVKLPWRAMKPPVKKPNEKMRIHHPTLWDERFERRAS
jgi:hypothetical protein